MLAAGAKRGPADVGEEEIARKMSGEADAFGNPGKKWRQGGAKRVRKDVGNLKFMFFKFSIVGLRLCPAGGSDMT